jgi:hypothetical protein
LKERIEQMLVEAFQMGFDLEEVLKMIRQHDLASRNPSQQDRRDD